MRHFLPARAVPGLPGRVSEAATPALLVALAGGAPRRPPRLLATRAATVAIAAIAVATEEKDAAAVGARADD
jgi:hypothetical protein